MTNKEYDWHPSNQAARGYVVWASAGPTRGHKAYKGPAIRGIYGWSSAEGYPIGNVYWWRHLEKGEREHKGFWGSDVL